MRSQVAFGSANLHDDSANLADDFADLDGDSVGSNGDSAGSDGDSAGSDGDSASSDGDSANRHEGTQRPAASTLAIADGIARSAGDSDRRAGASAPGDARFACGAL